jgi:hypothetical protein
VSDSPRDPVCARIAHLDLGAALTVITILAVQHPDAVCAALDRAAGPPPG